MSRSGGCQCGAVRYRVAGELGRAGVCHCRMCQKAFGAFYAPYVSANAADVVWTRGAPKIFRSSDKVRRGFCGDCGTQLTFEVVAGVIDLTVGSFDDPAAVIPAVQINRDARLPYVDALHALPAAELGYQAEGIVSHQHPDHDTDEWRPRD